eukprot:jgi/Botrbrau1/14931/Bobra.0018s0035.1
MLTTFRSCLRNGSAGDISRLAGATWSVLYPPIGDARGSRAYSAQTDTPVLKSKKEKESNLYVFNVEGRRNNSPVLLGLMDYFERFIPRIGYFQPLAGEKFVNSTTGLPRHVELLHTYFKMGGDPKAMVALQREDALDMLTAGQEDEMLDAVYAAFQQYSADKGDGHHRGLPSRLRQGLRSCVSVCPTALKNHGVGRAGPCGHVGCRPSAQIPGQDLAQFVLRFLRDSLTVLYEGTSLEGDRFGDFWRPFGGTFGGTFGSTFARTFGKATFGATFEDYIGMETFGRDLLEGDLWRPPIEGDLWPGDLWGDPLDAPLVRRDL